MSSLFVIDDVSVNFGGLQALQGVSITLDTGSRHVLLGSNGAGKTTLFNILSGLVAPTTGHVLLAGEEITRLAPHQRARRGLARTFQITTLFDHLSVLENVQIAVQALDPASFVMHRPASTFARLVSRTDELLKTWGLWEKRGALARTLSYGEQRQVEMVMALAHKPKVLLLDEPAAGLSAEEKVRMVSLIRALDKEIAVLLIEHHMDVAFALANEVTVLHQGRVVAQGPADDVRRDPGVSRIYLGSREPAEVAA